MPNVLVVPDVFATIQAAHDAAIDGDTILLQPGTYTGAHTSKILNYKGNTEDPVNNRVTINGAQGTYGSQPLLFGQDAPYQIPSGAIMWLEGLDLYGSFAIFGGPKYTVTNAGPWTVNFVRCNLRSSGYDMFRETPSSWHACSGTLRFVNTSFGTACPNKLIELCGQQTTCDREGVWQANNAPLGCAIGAANDYRYGGTPPDGYGWGYGDLLFDQWGPDGRIFKIAGRCLLNGSPTRATLRCIVSEPTWTTIAETESDAVSGEYDFGYLNPYKTYYVEAEIPGERPQLHGPIIPQP